MRSRRGPHSPIADGITSNSNSLVAKPAYLTPRDDLRDGIEKSDSIVLPIVMIENRAAPSRGHPRECLGCGRSSNGLRHGAGVSRVKDLAEASFPDYPRARRGFRAYHWKSRRHIVERLVWDPWSGLSSVSATLPRRLERTPF